MKIDRKYLLNRHTTTVTATPYTVDDVFDDIIFIDVASAATINLPAGTAGKRFCFSDESSDAFDNNITIMPNGGDTIEGGSSYIFNLDGEIAEFAYNATTSDWVVIASPIPPEINTLLLTSPAMGVESGGALSDGGGFVVSVASGTGFFSNGTAVRKYVWGGTSITLSANVNKYIYFDNTSTLIANASFPDTSQNILLGRVVTNGSAIDFIDASPMTMKNYGNLNDSFVRKGLGVVYHSGSNVTENATPLHLDISAGSFYFGNNAYLPSGGTNITFETYYQDGSGGWTRGSTNTVDNTNFDPGTGTLAAMTALFYAKHALYIVGSGAFEKYLFVYSQVQYATLSAAEKGNVPNPPPFFGDGVASLAAIIVQKSGVNLQNPNGELQDARPTLQFKAPSSSGVTLHANLSGLSADDHTQYLLVNGTRAMAGALNMGTNNVTNVGTVDGVTVSAHAARHNPGGADALATAAPVTQNVDASNTIGSASSYAKSDHLHNIPTAAPTTNLSAVTSNAQGSANTAAKSDHSHAITVSSAKAASTIIATDSSSNFASGIATLDGEIFTQLGSAPSAPASGLIRLYNDLNNTFNRLRMLDSTGLISTVCRDAFVVIYNNTGGTLNKGQPVYVSGSISGTTSFLPTVALAKADSQSTLPGFAILAENVANNSYARAQFQGTLSGFDTSAFSAGALLYLSAATAGAFTATAPTAPNSAQPLAFVLSSNATTGSIFINIKSTINTATGTNSSSFQVGPATGSSNVTLAFSNSNTANLIWNPAANFNLILPNVQGAASSVLQNDGAGNLIWNTAIITANNNYDGGTSSSTYGAAIVVDGGTS